MIHDDSDERRARREAAEWFAHLKNTDITAAKIAEFRAWRAHAANDEAYGELERMWRSADVLERDSDIHRIAQRALRPRRRSALSALGRPPVLALAAGLAVACAAVGYQRFAAPTYETPVGEQRLVELSDGSQLRLDTDSKAVVRFGSHGRRIVLKRGQAFFDVAHDPQRPFVVEAGDMAVTALGTRFDVRRADRAFVVTLVEGAVEVRSTDKSRAQAYTLGPGEQLAAQSDGEVSRRRISNTAEATSWTTGQLTFRETPLDAAVAEINRYTKSKVVLGADDLADERLNGVFKADETDAFVSAIATLYDLQARKDRNGKTVLTRAGGAGA
ncbi:FecR family protein [Caulobacter sp. NIBR2454]|uniref:FecR family protein n=1 Tax=Caulobacter sp. NIBR2454 TaxID=3015996 RepID=UPI0022B6C602|nr:FecR domain-containing protein [Caulobacter sp. NIBR2454]